jgi:hypothetical protein
MALTQQQRDEKRREKADRLQEEDLRLKVRPGTKKALADLMEWAGIDEQGEALTLMIHHLHALGSVKARPLLEVPHHEYAVSPIVVRKLDQAYQREALRVCHDE